MARGGKRDNAGRKPKAAEPEPTAPKQSRTAHLAAHQFQPGQSGNPAGRQKGSRNKLGEAFLADFLADWEQHGAAAIAEVRETRPQDYLKAAVMILPKEVKVTPGDFDDMSDAQLDRLIRSLANAISLEIGTGESLEGTPATH